MKTSYRTAPEHIERMPSGIPYIVGNEAAERFSFYGMKCILIIFMTKYLMDHTGGSDVMSAEQAKVGITLSIFGFIFFHLPVRC